MRPITCVFDEEQLKDPVISRRLKKGSADLTISLLCCGPGLTLEAKIFIEREPVGGCNPLRIQVGAVLAHGSLLAGQNQKGPGQGKAGKTGPQAAKMAICIQQFRRSNHVHRCERGGDLPRAFGPESNG